VHIQTQGGERGKRREEGKKRGRGKKEGEGKRERRKEGKRERGKEGKREKKERRKHLRNPSILVTENRGKIPTISFREIPIQ